MIHRSLIDSAVQQLAEAGIDVTAEVRPLRAAGTTRADDHLFVHIVQTPLSAPLTWCAVFRAFHPICPGVHIT